MRRVPVLVLCACALGAAIAGCGGSDPVAVDGGDAVDASGADGGAALDAAVDDAGGDAASDGAISLDGGAEVDAALGPDAGIDLDASGERDAGTGGTDGGGVDSDSGPPDSGPPDSGPPDSGPRDAGPPDAGGGGCVSGAIGTHVARFRWAGSGSGSTAYVVYERNSLPDTSRWRVTANSTSIGYRPVFSDVFLGEGGLELGGTAFIDVELSTVGLSSLRGATIAIYGRSFHTTASGSFRWQTFDGTGASPSGSVANSAPYEWYAADATAQFSPGDGSILLRLRAGPPSGTLIVNRVEICFDAT